MSLTEALEKEVWEKVRHLVGNPVFAIETGLDPLRRRVREGRVGESLEIIDAIQRSLETIKKVLHRE